MATAQRKPAAVTEDDCTAFNRLKSRLQETEEEIASLREKIISFARFRKVEAFKVGRFTVTAEPEERRNPSYKDAVINLAGEEYVTKLIASTKPQIVFKIKVLMSEGVSK